MIIRIIDPSVFVGELRYKISATDPATDYQLPPLYISKTPSQCCPAGKFGSLPWADLENHQASQDSETESSQFDILVKS